MLKSHSTPPSTCSGGSLNRSKISGLLRFGQMLIGAALLTVLSGNARAAVVVGSVDDGFVPTAVTLTTGALLVPMFGIPVLFSVAHDDDITGDYTCIYTGDMGNGVWNYGYIQDGWSYLTTIYQAGDALSGSTFGPGNNVYLEYADSGPASGLTSADDRYLGFFDGSTNYGWIQFRYDDAGNSLTVVDYAYGTAGEQLLVGAVTPVPEPGSAVLALVGAAGFFLRRRRRSCAA